MRLRVGTLAKALGGLLGLFVGIPVVVVYASNHGLEGQVDITLAVFAIVAAGVRFVPPGWLEWLWGTSVVGNLMIGLACACFGINELHVAPEALARVIGWAGLAFFVAALVVSRRRSAASVTS